MKKKLINQDNELVLKKAVFKASQLWDLSNKELAGTGLMIGEFTMLPTEKEQYFSGISEVGFGWSPYPGDYRSRAAIEAGRVTQ